MSKNETEHNKESLSDYIISPMAYLTALFVCLKLFNVIEWDWIWVLCPLWFPPVFAIVIFVALMLFELVLSFKLDNKDQDKKK